MIFEICKSLSQFVINIFILDLRNHVTLLKESDKAEVVKIRLFSAGKKLIKIFLWCYYLLWIFL